MKFEELMIMAIQSAYYKEARNPSDDETLIELAAESGLEVKQFSQALNSEKVKQQLIDEIEFTKMMFVESFPSLIIEINSEHIPVIINYTDYQPMLDFINKKLI